MSALAKTPPRVSERDNPSSPKSSRRSERMVYRQPSLAHAGSRRGRTDRRPYALGRCLDLLFNVFTITDRTDLFVSSQRCPLRLPLQNADRNRREGYNAAFYERSHNSFATSRASLHHHLFRNCFRIREVHPRNVYRRP